MKGVGLVSGGIDSSVMVKLLIDNNIETIPLFIDYGQLAASLEWKACKTVFSKNNFPKPISIDLKGFGSLIKSGITDSTLDINDNAFLPGRNLMLLVLGSSYAYNIEGNFVALGLLKEDTAIFPDQNSVFIKNAEKSIEISLNKQIKILTPLEDYSKVDVISLADEIGVDISGTYSCHMGKDQPCKKCISCKERYSAEQALQKS